MWRGRRAKIWMDFKPPSHVVPNFLPLSVVRFDPIAQKWLSHGKGAFRGADQDGFSG
jgi:hypothetical protein